MPNPGKNEKQSEFISRCVPILMDEGKTQNQALGQCYGVWKQAKKKANSTALLGNGDEMINIDEEIDIKEESKKLDKKE
jgi:hypothetical protein